MPLGHLVIGILENAAVLLDAPLVHGLQLSIVLVATQSILGSA